MTSIIVSGVDSTDNRAHETRTLPPLQAARIRLVEAMEHLDRVFSHTGHPASVQVAGQAVKDAADNYADTRRETVRGAA